MDTEKPGAVADSEVAQWARELQDNGVKRVVCLLKEEELQYYQ